jgi:hypothetical protein
MKLHAHAHALVLRNGIDGTGSVACDLCIVI